jgi:hypothetical protein
MLIHTPALNSIQILANKGTAAPSDSNPLKLSGGGMIASNEKTSIAIFGFSIKHKMGDSEPKGILIYQDHKLNLRFQVTSFDRLAIQGDHAWIAGTGRIGNGRELKFTVEIDTNLDTFYIDLPAFEGYKAGGALSGGNVKIH